MRTSDFDYALPPELIAQEPAARREDARLLRLDRRSGEVTHGGISEFPALVRPGDLLVANDTRVLGARLFGRRETGGRVEMLLVEPRVEPDVWTAMVRAGGSLRSGERLAVGDDAVLLIDDLGQGRWTLCADGCSTAELMDRRGKLPLPPYIRRDEHDRRDPLDRERYQTVFAREPGAIAAPTAGLHLTDALLEDIRARGAEIAYVTLHVGPGTFQPVRGDDLADHEMHSERFTIPSATSDAVRRVREAGGRVIAVGTTTVRALEGSAAAATDGLPVAESRATDLFITPGHEFRAVDALLTNFHLPRSTLLCLVSAFAGREAVLAAYVEAVSSGYRFYSYGDAMLIA